MVTHTWGFVKTRPGSPWTKVEVRAERGAILRVSGTSYAAVLASLARIRSAFQGAHVRWPGKALTLHFHPACHASELAQLDLPIALSLLAIQGHVSASSLSRIVSWGMVGLDGEIKAEAHRCTCGTGWGESATRAQQHREGARARPCAMGMVRTLRQRLEPCRCTRTDATSMPIPGQINQIGSGQGNPSLVHAAHAQWKLDWTNLEGEGKAKAWLCIAAKTRMPVLLTGPPGVGKSSLAKAAHGLLSAAKGTQVPFYAPHPSGGTAGLLGSWRRGQPIPGAWALADGGVLFLDEFAEWPRPARESLRHIMETGNLHLHRAEGSAHWQSTAWLLAAMNLCPCGQHPERCVCDTAERKIPTPLERTNPRAVLGSIGSGSCGAGGLRPNLGGMCELGEGPLHPDRCRVAGRRPRLGGTHDEKGCDQQAAEKQHPSPRRRKGPMERNRKVRPSDVQAAFDVTWMNRPGWWNG